MPSLLRRFLPPIIWMMLIYFLSSQSVLPGANEVWADFVLKKLAHVIEYAILYVLVYRAINDKPSKRNWMLPMIITVAYAISDEMHQSMTPGRHPTPRDVGFDTIGATLAMWKVHKRK